MYEWCWPDNKLLLVTNHCLSVSILDLLLCRWLCSIQWLAPSGGGTAVVSHGVVTRRGGCLWKTVCKMHLHRGQMKRHESLIRPVLVQARYFTYDWNRPPRQPESELMSLTSRALRSAVSPPHVVQIRAPPKCTFAYVLRPGHAPARCPHVHVSDYTAETKLQTYSTKGKYCSGLDNPWSPLKYFISTLGEVSFKTLSTRNAISLWPSLLVTYSSSAL